ncbi:MAG: SRPBCC domain-containing protein [Roseibium sp.]|jgi:uncharacterized protein YndB with AHSA1/START domain|nr:hypothetical protein [Roseibium sp.]MBO6858600.1 SRPBCC domain-containing protein [Roseibium sp.]
MSDQTPDVELATSVQGEMETADIVQEYELEAPPEKVWRAITIPTFRERWLPDHDLAQAEPVAVIQNEEILFRLRDDAPPFLESVVQFQLQPISSDRTLLTIRQRLADGRLESRDTWAANSNEPVMMLAA